jgi:hypothetical protein
VRHGSVGAELRGGERADDIAVGDPDDVDCFAGASAIAAEPGSRLRDTSRDDDVRGGHGAVVRADG